MTTRYTLNAKSLAGNGYEHAWYTNCKVRYRVFKGARSTKKSYDFMGLEPIFKILSDTRRNVLFIRQNFNTHKTSTFARIVKLIREPDPKVPSFSLMSLFKINNTDLTITRKDTGQIIFFKGMDDANKLTSIEVPVGYLSDIYIEEAFELSDYAEFRKLDGSLRESKYWPSDLKVQITFCFNAWNKKHWLYDAFFKGRLEDDFIKLDDINTKTIEYYDENELIKGGFGKGIYLNTSTYKVNEFRTPEYDLAMQDLKEKALDIYKVEALGMWGNASGSTYPYFSEKLFISRLVDINKWQFEMITFGVDSGLSNGEGKIYKDERIRSATTLSMCGITKDLTKMVAIDEVFISNQKSEVKKTPSDIADILIKTIISWKEIKYHELLRNRVILIYVDNADIAFRDILQIKAREYGLNAIIQPSTKIKIRTRVDFINLLMAYGDTLFYNTPNLVREISSSQVGENGEAREDLDDHEINAWEYAWVVFYKKILRYRQFKEH